jgi:hypothetical protein
MLLHQAAHVKFANPLLARARDIRRGPADVNRKRGSKLQQPAKIG